MLILTEDALIVCNHITGKVNIQPSQNLVTINGRCILVDPDPEGRSIVGCPNIGVNIKPCTNTLSVQVGYSDLLRIDVGLGSARRICLDTVDGLTDGTLPGTVHYKVFKNGEPKAGQEFVREN
jgi:hypothetical protein